MTNQQRLASLLARVTRFQQVLDATTLPLADGSRRVAGLAHAIELSAESERLQSDIIDFNRQLDEAHGVPVQGFPPGVQLVERDSEGEPWRPVPADELPVMFVPIGQNGADPALKGAVDSVFQITALTPGPDGLIDTATAFRQRWNAGDIITSDQIAHIGLAVRLLQLRCRPQESAVPKAEPRDIPDDAALSVTDIAALCNVDSEALRKRLERLRATDDSAMIEVANPKSREPKYLYRWGRVRPVVQELMASATASAKRPATEKR